jgi:type IV pilus assembly protein PilF
VRVLTFARLILLVAVVVMVQACSSTNSPAKLPPDVNPDDPTAATSLMQQGQAMVSDGRFEEGLKRYQIALQLQPNNPTVHNLIGVANLQSGQPAKALESFNKALALAPSYSDARNNRGATYARLGQFTMAEGDYLAVLSDATYANRAGVYFNLGTLYVQHGNYSAAEENLRKATIASGPAEAYFVLGQVEEKLSKVEQAEIAYRAALDRAPERVDFSLTLATFLERVGRRKEAAEIYRRIVALAPDSPQAAQARAKLGK